MSIQRHFILFILSLLVITPSIAHQKPYVINFARDKYHAANKNWTIGQDEKGITYFGNDIGLLEFDGIEWKIYQMPNFSLIRSLAVESHSTIYVGALGELGRWDRNQAGKLQYTSFKNMLPPKSLENESFWRIWIDNDKVYFQSFSNIYVYDHHTIQQLTTPKGFLLLTKVRNEYWVQEMYGSLYQLANKQLKKIKGSEFLNGTLTRVILPYGKENKYYNYIWDNTLTYNNQWGKHKFGAMAGYSMRQEQWRMFEGKASNVPEGADEYWYIKNGDAAGATIKDDGYCYRGISYFTRLNYNYDDKYLLMFTMRADGSSKYQEHWGYFPSVGAAWVLSEEPFMKGQKWADFLKLRASWGKLGNDHVAASDGFASIATGNDASGVFGNTTLAGYQNTTYFSWLKWEVVEEWNAGINFITLNNRLNIDFDYYHRMTSNAVIAPLLPFSTTTLAGNYGKILNSGIDISANWNDKIGKDFSYNIGINISTLRNRVKDLGDNKIIRGGKTVNIVGKEMNSFYGFKMIGVYQTDEEIAADPIAVANGCVPGDLKYADLDGNKVLDGNDRTTLGSYIPNFTYGINLGLNYKNLDFQLTTYGQTGAQMFNRKRALRYSSQNYNFDRAQYEDRWTGPGSTNSNPSAAALLKPWNVSDQKYSSYFVESADFFRIQNITLGYTFRNLKLGNYIMPGIRLSLTADRPFTTFKANSFSPELSDSEGWDTEVYPLTSSYTFGVRFDF